MSGQNILVSGTPRSGTTLTCHLLNKLPNTVALHEPMSVKKFATFASHDQINTEIDQFCAEQRESILTRGVARSKQSGGQVPDNPIASTRSAEGLRRSLVSRGEITIDKPLAADFTLVIKHNAAFAATVATLVKRFPVYAVIRNPLATLASWSTVAIPVQMGNAPAAERIDPKLQAALAGIDDELDRQIFLLDWYHAQYHTHLPAASIIRYEDVVESGGKALRVVQPEAASLDEPLASQNASKLYHYPRMLRVGERLLRSDGAHWISYTKASVEQLLDEMRQAHGAAAIADR